MKKWTVFIFLIICLIDFCYLGDFFLYAQYLNDDEDVELRIWNLKQQIKIEEESIRTLKGRHRYVVKEKERIRRAIEREKDRVLRIEKQKQARRKLFEADRQKEQERQLYLMEQIMLNQEQKRRFLEQFEFKRSELEKQKFRHERKLSEEETHLQQLELELINQRHMLRDRQMQLELEAAGRKDLQGV